MTVRTRFAPSPTGYLHIGGVRTALFNWLMARRHGGQFILRIDDTDEARHVDEAVELIQAGFRWLGMNWDEGPIVGGPHAPYFQSQRQAKYQAALEQLLETGWAYPCLADPREIELEKDAAKAANQPFVYRAKNRNMSPAEALAIYRERKPAIRFKVPADQTTVIDDKVRDRVEWQTNLVGDFTIARAGGSPLYNFATVVDDLDMKISHIIRAEEHLANTHPQVLIWKALGATELPVFAHVPFVAAPGTKKKLSKRNPPPGVMVALEEYEKVGYLPEAILNALCRLGWSLDDKSEIMSLQTVIDNFSLDRITKAPAGLDPDKMFWFQDHYMRALSQEERIKRMLPYMQRDGLIADPATPEQLAVMKKIDSAAGDRLKLLSDIVRYGGFFFRNEVVFDKDASKTLLKGGTMPALEQLVAAFSKLDDYSHDAIQTVTKEIGASSGLGGKVNHVLRAAVSGQAVGPGVYECVEILGKEKTLARLERARVMLASGSISAG